VYSHLSGIFIKEGDKVKRGTLIAKTAESTDGNILHFEIWNSRTNLNPEQWLAKK
jgi:murein DD-endopeptidase MepM/ murein hydrolase activator NlpD